MHDFDFALRLFGFRLFDRALCFCFVGGIQSCLDRVALNNFGVRHFRLVFRLFGRLDAAALDEVGHDREDAGEGRRSTDWHLPIGDMGNGKCGSNISRAMGESVRLSPL